MYLQMRFLFSCEIETTVLFFLVQNDYKIHFISTRNCSMQKPRVIKYSHNELAIRLDRAFLDKFTSYLKGLDPPTIAFSQARQIGSTIR